MWSVEEARRWSSDQPWLLGCNFIPSTAINQLEMWQAESFDPTTIDRELGWASDLGFNIIRVYLHDLLWEQDCDGFTERIERFLEIASRHRIGVMFVLFDDVWSPTFSLGPQPAPHPGRHNSGWVQSPGLAVLDAYESDPSITTRLEAYVRGMLDRFKGDTRVLVWDLYNEPGGFPSSRREPVGEACLPLLRDVFEWAHEIRPSQPLTCGLWSAPRAPVVPAIRELQLGRSDVVSFHHYGSDIELEELIAELKSQTKRPLICTEYLARSVGNRFENQLPIFQKHGIGAINWGLVSGKTQTIYPWESWLDREPKPEPNVWFHDILREDGRAFDPKEIEFLQQISKNSNGGRNPS
jgi:hypothetical protein